ATGVRLAPESVFGLLRNRCSACPGEGVRLAPEKVIGIVRSTHLADVLDALEQQPQLASLLSTHGKRQLMVAFADVTTSLLGIKQFGGSELAAVSVLMGEEAHSPLRDSDALTDCVERWKNARREAKGVRELLQQLLAPALQPAGVISTSTTSPVEAGSPSMTTPPASPHPDENTGETE
ncbi:hypothetical protein, partial [Myxococcus sp. AB025B]|uniref:hypothetical protein n=1 Tax=Myxococcus sp. AB025B TaxID=2562794 RepID=UPI001E4E2CBD